MTCTLIGQNIASWLAIAYSPLSLGLFLSISLYIGACMSDVAMQFNELDSLCIVKSVNGIEFNAVMVDLLEHHNWTIK